MSNLISDKPLVSIIINNYNYQDFISSALESCFTQSYKPCEIIVVDDGSTDGSRKIISQYSNQILVVFKDNGGQASAFNIGFAKSKGKYIFFLDSDDTFLPSKIEKIVSIFQENDDVGWCFHPLQFVDSNLDQLDGYKSSLAPKIDQIDQQVEHFRCDLRNTLKHGKLKGRFPFENPATSGLCFRRSCLERILPMPEEIKITSDDYIKYVAIGTAPGYVFLEQLSMQRIHGRNAYTLRKDQDARVIYIISITAYWIRKNFPHLKWFANNLFAIGLSKTVSSFHREPLTDTHRESRRVVSRYIKLISLVEKGHLTTKIFVNLIKAWLPFGAKN